MRTAGYGAGGTHDVWSYRIEPRSHGDYDGDFDVDAADGFHYDCFGTIAPCSPCAALDFNDDGEVLLDDFEAYYNAVTPALCECHGPCQIDLECEGASSSQQGCGELAERMPIGCELAATYVATHSLDQIYAFRDALIGWVDEYPGHWLADQTRSFLDCLEVALHDVSSP